MGLNISGCATISDKPYIFSWVRYSLRANAQGTSDGVSHAGVTAANAAYQDNSLFNVIGRNLHIAYFGGLWLLAVVWRLVEPARLARCESAVFRADQPDGGVFVIPSFDALSLAHGSASVCVFGAGCGLAGGAVAGAINGNQHRPRWHGLRNVNAYAASGIPSADRFSPQLPSVVT